MSTRAPLCLALLLAALASPALADPILISNDQKLAFLGDSITANGWNNPVGYLHLVVKGLEANGIKVQPIPAGISGHKSNDMLGRLERDVLAKKPDWMTLSCGVNDVWHGRNGVPLDQYKQNITAILDKCQAANVKVVVLTATMIKEDDTNNDNKKLADYNDFLRAIAKERHLPLADLNADMLSALKAGEAAGKKRGTMLTVDGVHMNLHGDMMMATGILRAFGLSDDQLAKAKEAWLDIPNAITLDMKYTLTAKRPLTLRDYQALEKQAAANKQSVSEIANSLFTKDAESLLKAPEGKKPQDALQEQFNKQIDELLKK